MKRLPGRAARPLGRRRWGATAARRGARRGRGDRRVPAAARDRRRPRAGARHAGLRLRASSARRAFSRDPRLNATLGTAFVAGPPARPASRRPRSTSRASAPRARSTDTSRVVLATPRARARRAASRRSRARSTPASKLVMVSNAGYTRLRPDRRPGRALAADRHRPPARSGSASRGVVISDAMEAPGAERPAGRRRRRAHRGRRRRPALHERAASAGRLRRARRCGRHRRAARRLERSAARIAALKRWLARR